MFYKKMLLLSVLSLSIHANESFAFNESYYDQGHEIEENSMPTGYNAPARIDVRNCWDFYVEGSFLYWESMQQGMELGIDDKDKVNFGSDPDVLIRSNGNTIPLKYDFDIGFRVGLGLNSNFDDWSVHVQYTYFHNTVKNKDRNTPASITGLVQNETMVGYWQLNPHNFVEFENTISAVLAMRDIYWRAKLDLLDLEIGRAYYLGTRVTARPYFGLKGGWIDQRFKVTYPTIVVDLEDLLDSYRDDFLQQFKSNSWVIGPRIGASANWILRGGLKFLSNVAVSLLYQDFTKIQMDATFISKNVFFDTFIITDRDKHKKINPCLEIALGLGWGSYFWNKGWYIDLSANYELQHFWNQNVMKIMVDRFNVRVNNNPGDLTVHGLTATLRLDF